MSVRIGGPAFGVGKGVALPGLAHVRADVGDREAGHRAAPGVGGELDVVGRAKAAVGHLHHPGLRIGGRSPRTAAKAPAPRRSATPDAPGDRPRSTGPGSPPATRPAGAPAGAAARPRGLRRRMLGKLVEQRSVHGAHHIWRQFTIKLPHLVTPRRYFPPSREARGKIHGLRAPARTRSRPPARRTGAAPPGLDAPCVWTEILLLKQY